MIHSYPTVYQIGHKAIQNLFDGEVTVEEKVDGSQFSFGIIDGELQCRSHGKQLILDAPEKMFVKIVEHVISIKDNLQPGFTYRGEYLEKPKHNVLNYSRVPVNNFIGFDVMTEEQENYFPYLEKKYIFECAGFETVPLIYRGEVKNMESFAEFLDRESILGGTKIEGVVVKNYKQFSLDKKTCMGKYVSEKFKEIARVDWKERNPTGKDMIQTLWERYKSVARWQKAVQHLTEADAIEGSPKDIGVLIREIQNDITKECEEEIKDELYKHAIGNILRIALSGFPEWYKAQLLESAFGS